MKDVRFLLQDFAELDDFYPYLSLFYFYNPITGKPRDLTYNGATNLISIPSLGWRGTFHSFFAHFETKTKHRFFISYYEPRSKTSEEKLEEIRNWLLEAYNAQIQLRKNLDETYRAGFRLEPSFRFELWAGPEHPFYIKEAPEVNRIFDMEILMDHSPELFRENTVELALKKISQTMNETDLVSVNEKRLIYQPRYSYITFKG